MGQCAGGVKAEDNERYYSSATQEGYAWKNATAVVKLDNKGSYKQINNFKVIRLIAKGTYGEVYVCKDRLKGFHYDMDTSVAMYAIKVVTNSKENSKAVLRELKILRQLDHPNIVKLYESIEDASAGHVFMIFEVLEGGVLCECNAEGRLEEAAWKEEKARQYFEQLVDGLLYLHAMHVVHRDIKPENIVYTKDRGTVKYIDFGESRLINAEGDDTGLKTFGTPLFFSPEASSGNGAFSEKAQDVWALGVTLFLVLVGRIPFGEGAKSRASLWQRISDDPLVFPENCGLSAMAVDLLNKMLEKDPTVRITPTEIQDHVFMTGHSVAPRLTDAVKRALDEDAEYSDSMSSDQPPTPRSAQSHKSPILARSASSVSDAEPGNTSPTYRDLGSPAGRSALSGVPGSPQFLINGGGEEVNSAVTPLVISHHRQSNASTTSSFSGARKHIDGKKSLPGLCPAGDSFSADSLWCDEGEEVFGVPTPRSRNRAPESTLRADVPANPPPPPPNLSFVRSRGRNLQSTSQSGSELTLPIPLKPRGKLNRTDSRSSGVLPSPRTMKTTPSCSSLNSSVCRRQVRHSLPSTPRITRVTSIPAVDPDDDSSDSSSSADISSRRRASSSHSGGRTPVSEILSIVSQTARPKLRFLVVDDIFQQRDIICKMLSDLVMPGVGVSCDILTAEDGDEAVRAVATDTYTAVLMDIHLPRVDGLLATTQIRRAEQHNCTLEVPIFGITGDTSPDLPELTRQRGLIFWLS
ncbi:Calcium/calmodulin-dependent protein kinase kinase [Diplonema papillatum]|nr:Calcium/calmodulin-dependent protein kinase kinase [Diplonema papillatum]